MTHGQIRGPGIADAEESLAPLHESVHLPPSKGAITEEPEQAEDSGHGDSSEKNPEKEAFSSA
jgi:hypothetical protein